MPEPESKPKSKSGKQGILIGGGIFLVMAVGGYIYFKNRSSANQTGTIATQAGVGGNTTYISKNSYDNGNTTVAPTTTPTATSTSTPTPVTPPSTTTPQPIPPISTPPPNNLFPPTVGPGTPYPSTFYTQGMSPNVNTVPQGNTITKAPTGLAALAGTLVGQTPQEQRAISEYLMSQAGTSKAANPPPQPSPVYKQTNTSGNAGSYNSLGDFSAKGGL